MYRIAKIINTHGLHGEVKLQLVTDFTQLLDKDEVVYMNENGKLSELEVEKSRQHKHQYLVKFKHFNSINEAEPLKGYELYVKESQLPELEERQYHYFEIIGCEVYTLEGDKIGDVVNILSPGANDVWVVKDGEGKEHLIPFINDVVKDINVKDRKISIELMEGLLD